MDVFLRRLAIRLHPTFPELDKLQQVTLLTDMVRFVYGLVLTIIAFSWLLIITDVDVLTEYWEAGLLTIVTMVSVAQFNIYIEMKIGPEVSSNFVGNLTPIIVWTFLWIFGPDFLWYLTVGGLILYLQSYRKLTAATLNSFWQLIRTAAEGIGPSHLSVLAGLWVYDALGGEVPVESFTMNTVLLAIATLFVLYIFSAIAIGGFVLSFRLVPPPEEMNLTMKEIVLPAVLTIAFLDGLHILGMFGAMIQTNLDWAAVTFYLGNIMLLGYVAQKFSQAIIDSKRRTQEMSQVTALGRALIDAPPDGSMLESILQEHVSALITNSHLEIVLLPNRVLLHNMAGADWKIPEAARPWLRENQGEHRFYTGDTAPWSDRRIESPVIVMPVTDRESERHIGYIWVEFWSSRNPRIIATHLNAVRALADQISAALHAETVYEQMLTAEKAQQELALAGEIQASFLPEHIPLREGWQIAAMIEPARQTSGDFFDFIDLPDNRLGIVVADVADKGTGAALFMALARTLIRTYASQSPDHPAQVFSDVNARMLEDSRSGQFVTAFYGVLNPAAGTLVYANAGHNPGYFYNSDLTELGRTGIPLGMMEDRTWKEETLDISSGCPLVLYTDGVTEAQNSDEDLYDPPRLIEVIKKHSDEHAEVLKDTIVEDVHKFIGDAPQADDITVVVIKRT